MRIKCTPDAMHRTKELGGCGLAGVMDNQTCKSDLPAHRRFRRLSVWAGHGNALPLKWSGMNRSTLSLALCLFTMAASAQQPAGRGVQGITPTAPGRLQTIEERTAGMRKLDGYFPLYWEERTGNLYLEIPRFDTEFLYATGLAAGLGSNDLGLDRGQEGAGKVV